jgi:DNA-binding NarL/FixJ family response regulator
LTALDGAAPAEARARLLFAFASAVTAAEIDNEPLVITAEALRLTPEQPPTAFRARLAALHARIAYIIGREVEAQRWALASIDIARLAGCAEAVADGQSTLALLKRRSDDPEEAARALAEVADQAYQAGDGSTEVRSRYGLGTLFYEIGDLDRALSAYAQTYARAVELGRPWELFGMHSRAMIGLIQYVRGDWSASVETLDTSAEAPPDLAAAMLTATGLRVRAGRGEADRVLATFEELRPWWPREGRVWLYSLLPVLEVYEQQGRADEALALIADAVRELGVLWQDEWFLARIELAARGVAVLTCAATRAPQAARSALVTAAAQLVSDGRTSADKGLPSGRRLGIEGRAWVERLEAEWARLRWVAGIDAPTETEHVAAWQRVVEAFGYGDVVQQSSARTRLAAVLRAAGRGPEAAVQADLARQAATAMGAVALLAEIRALGLTAPPRAGAGNDALTGREQEVLALLVEGRTNRQIAGQLYISQKTVSVHVSNILAKLGAGGRTEAAAIARRDGLLA